jgi:hypothetical protein
MRAGDDQGPSAVVFIKLMSSNKSKPWGATINDGSSKRVETFPTLDAASARVID